MKKGELFAPGLYIVTIALVVYAIGVISVGNIDRKNDEVGGIALDVISMKINHKVELLVKSKEVDIKEFFNQGASNKDSYKIVSSGESYKLWSKKQGSQIVKCYPNNETILEEAKDFFNAEKIELNNNKMEINFGKYEREISKFGSIYNYTLNYTNDLIVKLNGGEFNKAIVFFDNLMECGDEGSCYENLGGIKEIDNSYFFNVSLSDNINLLGVVTLNSGNPLTEKFEC